MSEQRGIHVGRLTKRDKEILDCIKSYMKEHGTTPTIREICDLTGLYSTNSVYVHFQNLVDMGYIFKNGNGHGYSVKGMKYIESR